MGDHEMLRRLERGEEVPISEFAEGWDPELTAGTRPRLPLMGRPAPAPPADRPEPNGSPE